uniref:Acid phosphatase n=1 Tax=Panagrellus redivivus TaxID=6233 RepID=A0A7E4VL92_PANRE
MKAVQLQNAKPGITKTANAAIQQPFLVPVIISTATLIMKLIKFTVSFLIFLHCAPISHAALKLLYAQVVWKNGAKSPNFVYKKSLYHAPGSFKPGFGELQQQGMSEHVKLSQKLRQRYVVQNKLISPKYEAEEIHVRSSDWNPSVTSAMAHMGAFFYGTGLAAIDYPLIAKWPGLWTPVPVHTVPGHMDELLNLTLCNVQHEIYAIAHSLPNNTQFLEDSIPFQSDLAIALDEPVRTVADAARYCAAILAENGLGLRLVPDVAAMVNRCKDFYADFHDFFFGFGLPSTAYGVNVTQELAKASGGHLLWDIIKHFDEKYKNMQNSPTFHWMQNQKYYVYSAHDMTLGGLFATLGGKDWDYDRHQAPDNSNAILLELWNDTITAKPIVKVLYWRKDAAIPIDISKTVTGCEHTVSGCTLEAFIKRSRPYYVGDNFKTYCDSSYNVTLPTRPPPQEVFDGHVQTDEGEPLDFDDIIQSVQNFRNWIELQVDY